jgi:hypothetical protein
MQAMRRTLCAGELLQLAACRPIDADPRRTHPSDPEKPIINVRNPEARRTACRKLDSRRRLRVVVYKADLETRAFERFQSRRRELGAKGSEVVY